MSDAKQIRQFLDPVLKALDGQWASRYTIVEPIGLALELTAQGVTGHVCVTACMVSGNVVSMGLEGPGEPHFQLYTYGEGDLIAGIARTCDLNHLLSMLEAWRVSQSDIPPVVEAWLVTAEERAHLAKIATGLAKPVEVVVGFEPESPGVELTPEGRESLLATLKVLDSHRLAMQFPREDDGRLPLDTDVLLAELATPTPPGADRTLWLCASSPHKRSDGARLTLRISDFIARNASYRWDETPWLFRRDVKTPSIDEDVLTLLGKDGDSLDDPPPMGEAPRAARCLRLLDAGRFADAFALYDIALDTKLLKVLAGMPLGFADGPFVSAWAAHLRRTLWESAPWIFPDLLVRERARIAQWRAERSGRPSKTPQIRLCAFPHQSYQRKAGLTLVEPIPGHAMLTVEWTASNARAPECQWKRSVHLDLKRFGLDVPAPTSPKKLERKVAQVAVSTEPLADALRGRKLWDVARALKLARSRPLPQAIAELTELLGSGTPDERRNTLHLFHALARPEDAPPLMKLLADPIKEIRSDALRTIRKLRHMPAAQQVARRIIEDPETLVRMEGATTLKALGSGSAASVKALGTFMTSPDPLLRQAACVALLEESRGIGPVVDLLRQLLDDPDPTVAAAAQKAARKHEVARK